MQIVRPVITRLFQSYRPRRNRYANLLWDSHDWTLEEARSKQRELLAETLRYCMREIPFYRKRVQVDPNCITAETAEESLLAFPVLTSEMVKKHFKELQCPQKPKGAFLNRSGGTTGLPTSFYLDQESEDWVRGTKRYHAKMTGYRPGDSLWVIWGAPEEFDRRKRSKKARLADWINQARRFRGFSLSERDLDEILEALEKEPPVLLLTYVDIMDRLAARAEETNRMMLKNMRMMVTAGTLYQPMRERIERVFGSSLYNCYGSREFGDLAMSCMEKQGLHIAGLSHYLEVADKRGNRMSEGKTGEILVTSMVNRTMPLIRYAIQDQGSLIHANCGCGNPWPRLETLEGRSQDVFLAPDGRRISPNAMVHFCWAYGTKYNTRVQMVQRDLDRIEVHLLKNSQPVRKDEDFEAQMRLELENLFHTPLSVDIIWKEELKVSPTGKYRMIRRELKIQ